jgi:hypothetical protein
LGGSSVCGGLTSWAFAGWRLTGGGWSSLALESKPVETLRTTTNAEVAGVYNPDAMDEALEVVDLLADSGLEGVVTWLLRLVGLVVLLAGVGLWLFTEMGLLVVPALLIVVGLVLLVAPSVLLALAELA